MPYTRKEFLKLSAAAVIGSFIRPRILSASIAGPEYITPTDAAYESLIVRFNKRIEQRPKLIAICRNSDDVSQAIIRGKQENLPIAIKSGGHNFEGYSSNNDGMVIDLSRINHIRHLHDNTHEIGPAALLKNVYKSLIPRGRIISAGSCGTVGIGGLTLGGGYGFFSRQYGLTCDNLIDATFIDGKGNVHKAKDDPELLWALRGGGTAGLGVVTNLTFKSHPAPKTFTSHRFKKKKLTASAAKHVLEEWFTAVKDLPISCFSGFVLNGRSILILLTNYGAHSEHIQTVIDKLRAICGTYEPGRPLPLAKALRTFYGRQNPLYFKNASAGLYKSFEYIRSPIQKVLEVVTNTHGMIYQVNTLGGNIVNKEFETASCYPHRALPFLSELQTYWESPSQAPRLLTKFSEVQEIFHSHGIHTQYANYCNAELTDWQHGYYGNNYEALRKIKRRFDPDNIFRHPQSIRG